MTKATFYDANQAPDGMTWQNLTDAEQQRLIRNYLERTEQPLAPTKKQRQLQVIHYVLIERDLAGGHGPSVKALSHLLQQGKTRQEALNILISLLVEHLKRQAWSTDPEQNKIFQRAYNQRLMDLTTNTKP
jgi:hypothetical protein